MFGENGGLSEDEIKAEEAKIADNELEDSKESLEENIKKLFDELEFKVDNPELIKKIEETENYHEKLDILRLEVAKIPGDAQHLEEYIIAQVKIMISGAKFLYEMGEVENAIDALNMDEQGVTSYAYYSGDDILYNKINNLVKLLYKMLHKI